MSDYHDDVFLISLDFDGVLGLGVEVKRKYAKLWYGLNLTLEQTKKSTFDAHVKKLGMHISYAEFMNKLQDNIMEYEILPYCKDVLKRLHDRGFRFIIVTSRTAYHYPFAKKFVEAHYGDLINSIHNTHEEPKDEFMRKLKPRIHLDDDLHKLIEIQDEPVSLAYFRQPENAHKPNSQTYVAEILSWPEFEDYALYIHRLHEAICWKHSIDNTWHNLRIIHDRLNNLDDEDRAALLLEFEGATQ